MNLTTQVERWHKYWRTVTSAADAERQLKRLYFAQEFVFASGPAIRPEYVRALHEQIEIGEKKLAKLHGDLDLPVCSETPSAPTRISDAETKSGPTQTVEATA